MPVNIGPRIGIEGEAEYRRTIQNIIQQQKTLKSEMQSMASAWDKDTAEQKKNAQQRENLSKQVQNQKDRLAELENMMEKSAEKYGENSTETLKWKQAVNEATTELNRLETELKNIPNGLQQMGDDMEAAGQKIGAIGDALMPISVAAAAVGAYAVKTTADFDSSMSKVAAISGATGKDFDALRAKAREMGAQTKFSASEAADAFQYMAMAGWKTEDMMDGISGIMSLSAADGLDLATTSDIVTDSLSAFNLTAKDSGHFADVLAAASTNANTNVSMMGETFKYAAPVAGALGFSIEDVAVATGLMANAGIKGSQAGTAMRGFLTRLAKPTKESATAMDFLDIEIQNADGSMKSLSEILHYTKRQFDTLNEAEKAQYAAMLAGQNGMSGLLAIMNAADSDIEKLEKAVDSANGTAEKMAETMQDNLNGQLTILKSAAEEAAISVGDALVPRIRKGVSVVQDFTNWFNNLNDEQKQYAINAGIAAAAAGPFFKIMGAGVETTGKVVKNVGDLAAKVQDMGGIASAANAVLGSTAAQIGLVAAPLVILAAAFVNANNKITGLDSNLINLKDRLDETGGAIEQNDTAIRNWLETTKKSAEDIQLSDKKLEHWRDQLNKCYDETGNLKDGMQNVAEFALNQLNQAMGTDYSTEFIAQAKDSAAALGEINAAIDQNIAKMKEQALQAAFEGEYTEAIRNQVEAHKRLNEANLQYQQTVDGAKRAVQEFNQAQAEASKTSATGGVADPQAVARLSEATKKCNEYRAALEQAGGSLTTAAADAAAADSAVSGLNTTMETMAQGGAENINKAAEAYANISTNAETAGQKAEEATQKTLTSFQGIQASVIQAPSFDQEDAAAKATATTQTMQNTFNQNQFTGQVKEVTGGDQAAMNAAGQMTKIIKVPMQGKVDRVDGAEAAAQDARSVMQQFLDNHPIIAKVVQTVTGGAIGGHADGGFVQSRQLSWLAEDGAEVVIPLSASKRGRALDLFEQTGTILGVGSAMIPSGGSTTSNAYHYGGNVINVYGAPGQDVRELAETVADLINGDVQSKGAVWA